MKKAAPYAGCLFGFAVAPNVVFCHSEGISASRFAFNAPQRFLLNDKI
jgi:hypothetical protein